MLTSAMFIQMFSFRGRSKSRTKIRQPWWSSKCDPQRPSKVPDIYKLQLESSFDNISDRQDFRFCGNATQRGLHLTVSQFRGLVVKKARYSSRSCCLMSAQIIVPFCLMWIGLALVSKDKVGFEKLSLTSATLQGATAVYAVADGGENTTSNLEEVYRDTVKCSGGKPLKYSPTQLSRLEASSNLMMTRNDAGEHAILIGAIFKTAHNDSLNRSINVTALYNVQAYHSEPIAVATVMKAVHHYCMTLHAKNTTDKPTLNLAVQPLPLPFQEAGRHSAMINHKFCRHSSITVLVSMTFLTSLFTILLVKERMKGSKHLQYLSGVSPLAYYISTLLWDIIVYTVECAIIFSPLAVFDNFKYMYQNNGITLMAVLMSYGVASLPLIYTAQLLFRSPNVSVLVLCNIRVAAGVFLLLFSSEGVLLSDSSFAWSARRNMKPSLYVPIPSHYLLSSFYTMCIDFEYRINCLSNEMICENNETLSCCEDFPKIDVFIAPIMQFLCWTALLLLLDSEVLHLARICIQRYFAALKAPPPNEVTRHQDADVQAEHTCIESNELTDFIILKNIVKRHGEKIIIDNISVGVPKGECFCLLGREKTGKSTLLKILTGHTYPTCGRILINMQEDISTAAKARAGMSYCPQKDVLMDEFTGRDTLIFYGRLRGEPEVSLKSVTQTLMSMLRISDLDKLCPNYSTTDKKKLSVAVALIGEPRILVLDEPTFGMDYTDQKTVWKMLSRAKALQRTLIIASSIAEECEILCENTSRMSIMTEGKLACLASPSVLYEKYGKGYTVIVKIQTDESGDVYSHMPFLNYAVDAFTDVEIISDYEVSRLHFPNEDLNLGKLFAILEDGVRYFHVYDYTVQKTSLNHILYSLSVCPEEEYIEIPPGATPSFDRWPPRASSSRTRETSIN